MQFKRAMLLVEKFIADERYPAVSSYNQNRQVFDVLGLKETSLSAVVAWLLNPTEGHGMGDYFIKALLREVIGNKDSDCPVSMLELDQMGLQNLSVWTEYPAFDSDKSEERYIDILASDLRNKLLIVIEHKYGSSETNNQLTAYSSWVEGIIKSQPGYRIIRILMDGHEKSEKGKLATDQQDKWTIISHSWLLGALKQCVEVEQGSASQWILKDLYICLSGEYALDTVFAGGIKLMAEMACDHLDLVENFTDIQFQDEGGETNDLWGMDDIDLVQLGENVPADVQWVFQFLKKNETLLVDLAKYARLEWVMESLKRSFPNRFDVELYGKKVTQLNIFQKSWKKFQVSGQTLWPVYLSVVDRREEEKSELRLKLHIQKDGIDADFPAQQLASQFGKKLSSNWKNRTLLEKVIPPASDARNIFQKSWKKFLGCIV